MALIAWRGGTAADAERIVPGFLSGGAFGRNNMAAGEAGGLPAQLPSVVLAP